MQPVQNRSSADLGAFVLRVSLGVLFLAHGLMKVLVFGLPGTVGFFQSLGYPPVLAYLTILGEIGGGLLLIAGVFTRWIALALVPLMIGATLVHVSNGWVFSNTGGGWEFPVLWTVLLGVQALLGDGAFALRIPGLAAAPVVSRAH